MLDEADLYLPATKTPVSKKTAKVYCDDPVPKVWECFWRPRAPATSTTSVETTS